MSVEIVGFGEVMGLVTVAGVGPVRSGAQARLGFGGAEANVLVGASRLGVSGAWIGALGADGLGDMVTAGLRSDGIDLAGISRHAEAPTGAMVKHLRTNAAPHVDYLRAGSAFTHITPEDLPEDLIEQARILHVTGITAALGVGPLAALDAAITRARGAGTLVSFDVNHRTKLWRGRDPAPILRRLATAADVVFASSDEAALLLDGPVPPDAAAAAEAVAALGPRHVVLKEGAAGATMRSGDEVHHHRARVVSVRDAVGAGDALAAGVLVGLLRKLSTADTIALGVDLGTFAVTVDGDHEGAPTSDELAAFRANDGEVAR